MQANAVNGGQSDGPRDNVLNLLKPAFERLVSLDYLLAKIVQYLPLARQSELLFAALDKDGFELSFQRTNLLADSRLGHLVDLGGLSETFRFSQVTEHLQAFNLHKESETQETD
jgi:hypothetical protein